LTIPSHHFPPITQSTQPRNKVFGDTELMKETKLLHHHKTGFHKYTSSAKTLMEN